MKSKGFTLIEVLVTLVILAMFSSAVYAIFLKALKDTRNVEERTDASRRGAAILRLIAKDLESAVPSHGDSPYLVGSVAVHGGSRIEVLTSVDSREIKDGIPSDVIKVTYELYPSEENQGLFVLKRREYYGGARVSELEGEAWERVLSESVKEFNLEYFDGAGWATVWEEAELPVAVRIRLVLVKKLQGGAAMEAREREFPFETVVSIPGGMN